MAMAINTFYQNDCLNDVKTSHISHNTIFCMSYSYWSKHFVSANSSEDRLDIIKNELINMFRLHANMLRIRFSSLTFRLNIYQQKKQNENNWKLFASGSEREKKTERNGNFCIWNIFLALINRIIVRSKDIKTYYIIRLQWKAVCLPVMYQ